MDSALTRREFLERVFGAGLSASLLACAPRPAAPLAGELLGQNVSAGHLLRQDDLRERIAHVLQLPAQAADVVIAGGGPAGLSAAYTLRKAGRSFTLLELESACGGTARGGSSQVSAYPWGAHYLPVPLAHNTELIALLREMGVVTGMDADGDPVVSEPHLVRTPEERLFHRGFWYPGLYLDAGASEADRSERARFFALVAQWSAYRDEQGRRAFTLPTRMCSDSPALRALDAVDAETFMRAQGFRSPRLFWLLDYACRDDYGLRLAQTSAWAMLFYFVGRVDRPGDEAQDLITWPEGNHALVRHLARVAGDGIRTNTLVLDVRAQDDGAEVLAWDVREGRGLRYRARHAIVATPRFIAQRIAQQSASASYGSWMVANLHLRERPASKGAQLAWDNVLYDSPSLGYVCATHQRGSDFGPTVLTYYLPLCDADPRAARQTLFDGDLARWQGAVMLDLERAHPTLRSVVERVDVFRWGHAMVRPVVGSRFDPARSSAASARGRIHYAHSDLSALSLFEEAFDHGRRAALETL